MMMLAVAAVLAAAPAAAPDCAPTPLLAFVCGAERPEDLARIAGTPWLVASGFAPGAGLKLVDTRSRTLKPWFAGTADQLAPDPKRYPDCADAPDPALFNARGLSLRADGPGRSTLHVVNHGGRESVEVFAIDHSRELPTLHWKGCLLLPEGHVGNSVATYSDGTVLVSVLTLPGRSITDFVNGENTGAVFQRAPGDAGFRRLPGTELPGNNGLETARDDTGFYVVAFGPRQAVAFDRHDTRAPRWRATAPGFMPDNIHWDGGRLLAAGMVADEPACGGPRKIVGGVADGMLCHRGHVVAELNPETATFRVVADAGPDPVFNGVSAAVIVDDHLWLGSYQADRIAVRKLPDGAR